MKSNKTQLDASSWASGVYFLQIISNENGSENHITRKISVQH
ncbi:MAG: T9SS type A sorting domain-containing protein [Flavobacteriales bacterium]